MTTDFLAVIGQASQARLLEVDREGRITHSSTGLDALLGAERDQLVGETFMDILHGHDRARTRKVILALLDGSAQTSTVELRLRKPAGGWLHVEADIVRSPTEQTHAILVRVRDVSERKEREAEMLREVRWFEMITRFSDTVIQLFNQDTTLQFASGSIRELLGIEPSAASWERWIGAIHQRDRARVMEAIRRVAGTPNMRERIEYRLQKTNGGVVYAESHLVNALDGAELKGFIVYTRDVTERRIQDPHTGLPNQMFLVGRLRYLLKSSRPPPPFAVLLLHLDDFDKLGNLGESCRQGALLEGAARFRKTVGRRGVLVRLDGAQFAVLCDQLGADETARELVDALHMALLEPVQAGGRSLRLTVSIGIALGSHRYESAESVLRAARAALHAARHRGRSHNALYQSTMAQHLVAQVGLEQDLHGAIENGELKVHYQPIVTLEAGKIAGLEALVRWQHPERGMVSPGLFIPIAEETGQIIELGALVLEESCRQLVRWQTRWPEAKDLFVSVNLSPEQLLEQELLQRVSDILERTGAKPTAIKLELTETAFIKNPTAVGDTLQALSGMGFQLALDDFGTGYSSLGYLNRFPFDTLKIDRSFVTALDGRDCKSFVLVDAIAQMGRHLGMQVVAEGIETADQAELLRTIGCGYAQGYFFARPAAPDDIEPVMVSRGFAGVQPHPLPAATVPEMTATTIPADPPPRERRFVPPPSRRLGRRRR